MANRTVVRELASLINARLHCIYGQNTEWKLKYEDSIDDIIKEYLPSGSGIDSGTKIFLTSSTSEKIHLGIGFHHMDENGSYCGWSQTNLIVTASLQFGIDLEWDIPKNQGKELTEMAKENTDYLSDLYRDALLKEI